MKKIILCLALLLTLTGCKKTPLIEESDFKEGLKNAVKSEANEESYKAKYEDGKMKLSLYDLKYNSNVYEKQWRSLWRKLQRKKRS